ncbi:MAG: hypothetical protein B6D64_10555, partial [Bacteroidetes bacterium 4484_276]
MLTFARANGGSSGSGFSPSHATVGSPYGQEKGPGDEVIVKACPKNHLDTVISEDGLLRGVQRRSNLPGKTGTPPRKPYPFVLRNFGKVEIDCHIATLLAKSPFKVTVIIARVCSKNHLETVISEDGLLRGVQRRSNLPGKPGTSPRKPCPFVLRNFGKGDTDCHVATLL